jgi:hypothetical protein
MILSLVFVAATFFSIKQAEAKTTYHICPGSGETCNAEVTVGDNTLTVKSHKTKGGDSVTVEIE